MELNLNSFRQIVGTLLDVQGRGDWETSDETIEQLQELFQEVEDRIEGVVTDWHPPGCLHWQGTDLPMRTC